MSTRAQKLRLGIFLLLATVLFLGSIAVLAGLKLWNPRDRYEVRFVESISGLDLGSVVKMKGVRVGAVEKIAISSDVESVVVTLALNPGTPVPEDTRAIVTDMGITGLKFVELTGGSRRAKLIPPNTPKSIIQSGQSTLESLTGKAQDISQKMEKVLNNLLRLTDEDNRARVSRLLDDADRLAVSWEQMASGNVDRVKRILANVDRSTQALEKASAAVSRLAEENAGTLRETIQATAQSAHSAQRILQGLNPQATLSTINSAAQSLRKRIDDPALSQTVASLNSAANRLSTLALELSKVVRQRDRQIGMMMENLNLAASHLKEFSRSIKERPSLLLRGETHKERNVP